MSKMTQEQIQARMQRLDDVFHRMIVSLERLELFLEAYHLDDKKSPRTALTAVGTERDGHDDNANPPTKDSFYGEVQLDCSALYFQTILDDKEIFNSSVKFFLADLLEWYGGRDEHIPYDGVDAFVLPIIVSLSQQVKSVAEIMEVVEKYVAKIPNMSSFSDEVKADAIADGISKLILMMDKEHHKEHEKIETVKQVEFTTHRRGEAVDGYKRLIMAMLSLYDEAMPAVVVHRTVSNFLPEIALAVPSITESSIVGYFENKDSINSAGMVSVDGLEKETPDNPNNENNTNLDVLIEDENTTNTGDNEIPIQEISDSQNTEFHEELASNRTSCPTQEGIMPPVESEIVGAQIEDVNKENNDFGKHSFFQTIKGFFTK